MLQGLQGSRRPIIWPAGVVLCWRAPQYLDTNWYFYKLQSMGHMNLINNTTRMHHITPFWDEKFINFLGRGTAPPQTHPLAAYIRRLDSLVFVARPARPPQCSSGVDAHGVVVVRRTWRWSRRSTTCVVSWASRAPACMTSRPLWVAAAPFQTKYVHLTPSYIHTRTHARTHTHTPHTFNGPFSGTTRVSRYQKGKTNLDFTEARDSEWKWH